MFEGNFREGSKRDLYNLYDTSKEESDDIIHDKRLIKKVLLSDYDIIKLLHNTDLEKQIENDEADITDYIYKNIFPFLYLPDAQDTVRNFVCFDVDDIGGIDYNNAEKRKQITFWCVSHKDDVKTQYDAERQDLLSYIILSLFNWSTMFGTTIKKVYNTFKIIDNGWYCREIKFQSIETNNLVNGMMGNYNTDKKLINSIDEWIKNQ